MTNPSILDQLSLIAHECWCEHMQSLGWRPGGRFDPGMRLHDALAPFSSLHRRDRVAVRRAVEMLSVDVQFANAIALSRGSNREFLIEELTVGREVVFCPYAIPPRACDVASTQVGRIESWDADEDGELDVIRVRWLDGRLIDYQASLLELARRDELS